MAEKQKTDITELILDIQKIDIPKEDDQIIRLISFLTKKRKEKKITQEQLAKMCNIPRSTIARTETFVSTPSLKVLFKILNALKISFIDIDNLWREFLFII